MKTIVTVFAAFVFTFALSNANAQTVKMVDVSAAERISLDLANPVEVRTTLGSRLVVETYINCVGCSAEMASAIIQKNTPTASEVDGVLTLSANQKKQIITINGVAVEYNLRHVVLIPSGKGVETVQK